MAMVLKGKNMHYDWHNIQRRYFIETAKAVNFSLESAERMLEEMLQKNRDNHRTSYRKTTEKFSHRYFAADI
jgi:hypothetical protein